MSVKSAWSTIISSILEAGSFTQHGSTPKIVILNVDSIRKSNISFIKLIDEPEDIILDFTGAEIYSTKAGTVRIEAINETDRDNIYHDIKTIMKASAYGFTIDDALPEAPQKKKFTHNIRIEILD